MDKGLFVTKETLSATEKGLSVMDQGLSNADKGLFVTEKVLSGAVEVTQVPARQTSSRRTLRNLRRVFEWNFFTLSPAEIGLLLTSYEVHEKMKLAHSPSFREVSDTPLNKPELLWESRIQAPQEFAGLASSEPLSTSV